MNNIIAKITRGNTRDRVLLVNNIDQIQSTTNENDFDDYGKYLRAKLRFFFMSPCWKWHLKRQFPWKAWFQFMKIIIVTTQLILFGVERETHVIFISESNITFHHLFIRNWESSFETLPYPPSMGDFAVFTNYDFMDSINYAIQRFDNLTNMSLGLFDYHNNSMDNQYENNEHLVNLCINRFKSCEFDGRTHKYVLDSQIENICFQFNSTDDFNIEKYLLKYHNETINFCGLNSLTIDFDIHAIELKNQNVFNLPDCYHFDVKIMFDNNAHTGKIRQQLNSQARFKTCNSKIINIESTWTYTKRNLLITLDFLVLIISILSFILCIRSLWFGHQLAREVRKYYQIEKKEEKLLTWTELQVFYSYWYLLMIITDLMIVPGTIIKIEILFKHIDDYNAAGLLLGLSSLFSWIGILRYLTFFRKYNLLFLTIQKSLPLILRFLLCSIIIYSGFMFCGWVVLGPYHTKFRTLSTTFETMFGLIYGDDMYATFANIETESYYIWLFSQLYLYAFIILFIYVISSLIIALIIDGYDTVKKYYTDGFPKSRLEKFSEEDVPHSSEQQNWQDLTIAIQSRSVCFPCCFKTPPELTDMITRDTYLARNASTFT